MKKAYFAPVTMMTLPERSFSPSVGLNLTIAVGVTLESSEVRCPDFGKLDIEKRQTLGFNAWIPRQQLRGLAWDGVKRGLQSFLGLDGRYLH